MLCSCEKGSHHVVVKALKKEEMKHEWMANEEKAGEVLQKKGICKFKEAFEDERYKYIVMEYVKGEDLWEFMKNRRWKALCEKDARSIFRQIVKTVKYCHEHGVAHKDIKLENIMIDKKHHTTLIDFGFCEFCCPTNLSKRFDGTLDYMPPEELLHIPFDPYKADVFALGVLLYVLLTGTFPFEWRERYESMSKGEIPQLDMYSHEVVHLSECVKDLLTKMLEPVPADRITVDDCLHHHWMRKGESFLEKILPLS